MDKHKDPIIFTIVTLIGNLFPTLLSVLIFSLDPNNSHEWNKLYNQGQFYLYSAAILTTSAYTFYTFKLKNTDWNSILCLISGFIIIIASIFYLLNLLGFNNNPTVLFKTSFIIFPITVCIYYYSNYINPLRVDLNQSQRDDINKIMDQL